MQQTRQVYFPLANRRWTIGVVAALIVLSASSVGVFLFARDRYSENQIRHLIQDAYNHQRPGGGRLFGAPYSPLGSVQQATADLGRAQFLLLRYPDSASRRELQGQIYLGSGEWRKFIENVNHIPAETRKDPATLNNLGACYLAISSEDPTYLFKALDQFEQAAKISLLAPEPRFNLIITYRKLRLPKLEAQSAQQYAAFDRDSAWHHELTSPGEVDESRLIDELRLALESNNLPRAGRLFAKDAELYRRFAMRYGLANGEGSERVVRFIGSEIERRYDDKTVSDMLAPLYAPHRDITIAARTLVTQGAGLYIEGNFQDSLEIYDQAEAIAAQKGSLFDRLWIDINRVDSLLRSGDFDAARGSLERIVPLARQHKFKWLLARALTIYGSQTRLTATYSQLTGMLTEAERLFHDIAASNDRVRPLYYLAFHRYGAGDQNGALKLALECLPLTEDDDFLRISSLDWLIGSILYRQGMPSRAVPFELESLESTQKAKNAALETAAASTLAQLYASMSEPGLAEHYSLIAAEAMERVPTGLERVKAELPLNLVKARIALDQKRYEQAEDLLEKNLNLYSTGLPKSTFQHSQSLMLLARSYAETARFRDAAQKFNEAIRLVENDDEYLKFERLRVKFDDERRDLYDSAIAFEYTHGSSDAAWTYLQKYRAKLFLEFLAQFNPGIEQLHGQALNRSRVQKVVGHDSQVIEYALLKDRMLIWLISDKFFTVQPVAISRSELEGKIQVVLQKLRDAENADLLLEELGKILIEPVAHLLDPSRTVVIIPDRALHGLPFGALKRPGRRQYLIEEFAIMVSPSLTHLLATNAARPPRDTIVGFGSQNGASSEIREVEALKNIYPKATTVAGQDVDREGFLSALNTAAVFHYAGHAATDAVDPLRSSILLDGDRYGPNSVTAVDISQQRLPINAVVILSSCDSSVGNSRDGVGVRGLTSAFLIGGAGSVVGSLWPVEASSTAELMIRFHRYFASSHLPVAQALRQTQLTFMQAFPERAHPYYWSGFMVTGNFSAMR